MVVFTENEKKLLNDIGNTLHLDYGDSYGDYSVDCFYLDVKTYVDTLPLEPFQKVLQTWQMAINVVTHLNNHNFLTCIDAGEISDQEYIAYEIETNLSIFPQSNTGWTVPFVGVSEKAIAFLQACNFHMEGEDYDTYKGYFDKNFIKKFPMEMGITNIKVWLEETTTLITPQMLAYQSDYRHRNPEWLRRNAIKYYDVGDQDIPAHILKEGLMPFLETCQKNGVIITELWGHQLRPKGGMNNGFYSIQLMTTENIREYRKLFRAKNVEENTIKYLMDHFSSDAQDIDYDYIYCNTISRNDENLND